METSEITISWECWPAAGSLPWVTFITFIEILEAGRQAGGMIIGSYLLLTLSWHSETSNCESKYSLHQENLPIMMGAGHYCDQLSHRSGKWDVINVAVNNNIRIYCGKITTAIEVKLDIKSCVARHTRDKALPRGGVSFGGVVVSSPESHPTTEV